MASYRPCLVFISCLCRAWAKSLGSSQVLLFLFLTKTFPWVCTWLSYALGLLYSPILMWHFQFYNSSKTVSPQIFLSGFGSLLLSLKLQSCALGSSGFFTCLPWFLRNTLCIATFLPWESSWSGEAEASAFTIPTSKC